MVVTFKEIAKVNRFWEVDTLRGIAIIMMIVYHFIWDLSYFGIYSGNLTLLPWRTFAQSIGTTFIFVMGVSLTLRYNHLKNKLPPRKVFQMFLLRGLKVFGWGMVVTFGTYIVIGRGFVIFGILHLLGFSMILAYPFLQSRWVSLGGGIICIAIGFYLNPLIIFSPWLIWLGVKQANRLMLDYYPLMPWFGVVLLGVFVGFTLYPEKTSRFNLPDLSQAVIIRTLSFLGQRSLLIYLIHQPILLGALIVFLQFG